MKKFLLYIIGFLFLFFLPNPSYKELNQIHIIDQVTITCDSKYHVVLREVIPKKKDNSIEYLYQNHSYQDTELSVIKDKILKGNKYYLKGVKKISNDCHLSDDFFKIFS